MRFMATGRTATGYDTSGCVIKDHLPSDLAALPAYHITPLFCLLDKGIKFAEVKANARASIPDKPVLSSL